MVIGLAGLFVGTVAGALSVQHPPGAPISITVATFPREVLGQARDDLESRETGSLPVLERLDAEFEDQRAGHRFAHGGDGATFEYGGVHALTIVNGFLVVTIPTAGDPPTGNMARLVSLRSTQTSCVSEQPVREFERRPPELGTASGVDAAAGPASTSRPESPFVWTDCVFVDRDRMLTLRLVGPGPAKDILGTASQFRDELQKIHADLIR